MKKLNSKLAALVAFSILFIAASQSHAAPPYDYGQKKAIDYDLEYVNKILKQDKKTLKISKSYMNKIKTNGVKQFAQAVIDKKEKQIKQVEDFIKEYEESSNK
ncbi:MAG: hypothetical protein WCK67_01495 [bacterium]